MGFFYTKEGNTFRDAILCGLKRQGITLTNKRLPGQDDLAIVLRRFDLPVDFSYAILSMFNGYPYHVGILYEGYVYSYMSPLDNLLNADLSESINVESLRCFKKQGNTEIYYITNDGIDRSIIKSRLIHFMQLKTKKSNVTEFNNLYGTGLGEYYNLFINNCEHVINAILIGKNVSFQILMVEPDIYYYWPLIKENMCSLPLFAQVWVNEYKEVMGMP